MLDFETPPARTLPEHRAAARQRALEAAVPRGHRRPRRPLLIAAVAVTVAVGASAGGYAYTSVRHQ